MHFIIINFCKYSYHEKCPTVTCPNLTTVTHNLFQFKPMNGRHNDPCHMSQIHDGAYNAWHQNPAIAKDFALYHEIKNFNQNFDIRDVTS